MPHQAPSCSSKYGAGAGCPSSCEPLLAVASAGARRLVTQGGVRPQPGSVPDRRNLAPAMERNFETTLPEASLPRGGHAHGRCQRLHRGNAPRVPLAGSIPIVRPALLYAMRRDVCAKSHLALVRLGARERDDANDLSRIRPRPNLDFVEDSVWGRLGRWASRHYDPRLLFWNAMFRNPSS